MSRTLRTEPTEIHVPPATRAAIRTKLLRWYDRHRRDLPWRKRAHDPYAQWVAEIMAQQTRVETVIGYYERFLARFPDVRALAAADHDEVLKYWEGLGYYRRALHMHRAAHLLIERGGDMPSTAAALRELPGIGDYTAAAISSIVSGEPQAAVDGNVARVIARLFGIRSDISTGRTRKLIAEIAQQLLPPSRPGDFNQAWMDLGGAVCKPRSPACPQCPLTSYCVAARDGLADLLPCRDWARAKCAAECSIIVGVFHQGGRVLVRRRPRGGLWSGLWEFPNDERTGGLSNRQRLRDLARTMNVVTQGAGKKTAEVRHELTHRRITFFVYEIPVAAGTSPHAPGIDGVRWVDRHEFDGLSVSTAHRKIHSALVRTISPRHR